MFEFLEHLNDKDEKKVEYVELIYDLIFVYMIGRNNALIVHVSNGFIDLGLYVTYVLCTLITIHIWYMTTLFINRYGTNSIHDYAGLFINMFLLYYMGDSIQTNWEGSFYRYNIAWALILANILIQYLFKYRQSAKETPWEAVNILQFVKILMVTGRPGLRSHRWHFSQAQY